MTWYKGKEIDRELLDYVSREDLKLDEEFIWYEIQSLKAHTIALLKSGIIDHGNASSILKALLKAEEKQLRGEFKLRPELEDVHTNLEAFIKEFLRSEEAGNIALARSRNDLIQTDTRMYIRDKVVEATLNLIDLIEEFIEVASKHVELIIPAYTHLRRAQPTTVAHWLLSYVDQLIRDSRRLIKYLDSINISPLEAGAVSGTTLPIDRRISAELLGFKGIQENTLDVSSSRGEFEAEALFNLTMVMLHLSRLSEDLIIWSSSEFGLVEFLEEAVFESSLMPQKRNPDVLEIVRARFSRLISSLNSTLTILKALPSGYSRDLQETKKYLIDGFKVTIESIKAVKSFIKYVKFKEKAGEALDSEITSTDLAEHLYFKHGIPFRRAYRIVSSLIKSRERLFEELYKLGVEREEILSIIDLRRAIYSRSLIGGPSPKEVKRMIEERSREARELRGLALSLKKSIEESIEKLNSVVREVIGGKR